MSTTEEQLTVGAVQRRLWALADVAFRSLGDYLQVDHVAPEAELASPTQPVRKIETFFAGAPDTTL